MRSRTVSLLTMISTLLPAPVFANDACDRLDAEDAARIVDGAVANTIAEAFTSGGMSMSQCRYSANDPPVRYVDLSFVRYATREAFDMLHATAEPEDEPVVGLGEQALWHGSARGLTVITGLDVLTVHAFRQDRQVTREEHLELMRRILDRR